ncbi:hypothetical protein EW146_g2975 [Bondarzewia mesenterica]|uniref:NADH:flavin oxidoreductase/NADH oxidase N-terminal domain-containing protein n=1 Tax=Bondarzewia mesenterica TaxID=1095465 RepID=A0A4S4M4X9_9AGAM|nr:hypothetical protein EW146_g2975 [Bondarzewia mesenterica]
MSSPSQSKLFQPIQVGGVRLQHRIVLAPLTRLRATLKHEPGPTAVTYYSQRASVPGTLLITEGTTISAKAGGFSPSPHTPGIWSDAQIAEWKKVVEAVHAKGSFIFVQLTAMGRAAEPSILALDDPSLPYVGPSDIPIGYRDHEAPRPLTIPEIKEYISDFATAASNAVHRAGFDGVEIHGANGYLVDQFLQSNSNNRTDEYGGSVDNRIRFALEVADALVKSVGAEKVGIRLSPWSTFQDMGMPDPIPTFRELVTRLRDAHSDLAFIHVVEPRISGAADRKAEVGESTDFLREIWGPRPYLAAGGFNREEAIKTADKKGGLIVFGRDFISNPDLPLRLLKGIPLSGYDRATFYIQDGVKGYIDYPFAAEAREGIITNA